MTSPVNQKRQIYIWDRVISLPLQKQIEKTKDDSPLFSKSILISYSENTSPEHPQKVFRKFKMCIFLHILKVRRCSWWCCWGPPRPSRWWPAGYKEVAECRRFTFHTSFLVVTSFHLVVWEQSWLIGSGGIDGSFKSKICDTQRLQTTLNNAERLKVSRWNRISPSNSI